MLQRQILAAAKQQFYGPSLPSIFHIQRRAKNVNFFQRRTDQVLWNTVTSITKYGARKGQARRRPQYRRTEQFYRVGTIKSSPMRVIYPGLTTQVDEKIIKGKKEEFQIHTEPMFIETQDPEEKEEKMKIVKTMIAERPPKRRSKVKEDPKLTPQERGFTGGQWLGQRLGCPPTNKEGVEFGDFECICFEVRRLAIMHSSYGKIMYMRVLVFIGNGNGVGGWAVARCPMFRTNEAIASGIKQATRNLFFVERFEDRTIYQDFFAECNNTRVYAQRQEPNFGVMAHPRVKKMCELLGIRDIYVRTEGTTNNYIALCQAFITGLINQETHQQCADRTRLHVVELSPNNLFYPRIVASPLNEPVKSDEEVELKERMRLEDYYGEGRFPLNWGPKLPWWRNEVGHLHKQWTIYPYRNMEQRMIRLMADGTIKRWTHRERKKWSDEENKKVESGEKPLPMGIGLSDYVPWEDDKNQPAPFLGDPSKFMEPDYSLMDGEQEAIGEEELEELAMAQEQQRPRN